MPSASAQPVIGLTAYVEFVKSGGWDEDVALLPVSYVDAVIRSGGFPVLLPPCEATADAAIGPLDGLILTGGPDVDPELYGAERHEKTGRPRRRRDEWEMALCRAALEEDLPLLAICRGIQVLNVALGGNLHQHLPDVVGNDNHRVAIGELHGNVISIDAGSPLASVLGTETEGLCHHHQGLDRLGRRVRAIGYAADGTVEAVEVPGQEFAIGVQWHPEDSPSDDRVIAALVDAAGAYRRDRSAD